VSPVPIRIVYLVSTLRRAGPTSQLLNIARHLDPARFAPTVVTLSPEPGDSMLPEFHAAGVRVASLAMSRARSAVHRGWRDAIERASGSRLDERSVVHSQGIRGDVISSTSLGGLNRLATARNYPYDDYPMKFGPLLGRWMAWRHLRAFRSLPTVVACSSALAGTLRVHGIESDVIRNGVDTSLFRPASRDERARLRSDLGLAAGSRIAVCVGALAERKDPLAVIRAARAMPDPSFALVMVGSGPLEAACREAARGDPRIRIAGQVTDVTPWLRAADFLVSASRSEGLPNSALEAMASGLHVLLTDIAPHRELLEVAPLAGELYALGDAAALEAAMARAASRAGARGGVGVAELLSAHRMSERYQDLYFRLSQGELPKHH
jgi:glycosyltransferase involved in cell wall biosynthesis